MIQTTIEMVKKYARPGPRYTSYPTAPNWHNDFGPKLFLEHLSKGNQKKTPLSLYFHIPFCEQRCTFCACNVVATRQRNVSKPYLEALIQEIKMVSKNIDRSRKVEQLHWGGGTPTYLDCEQIEKLYKTIQDHFTFAPNAEISIEVDPRVTSNERLKTLQQCGFNRVSLGVQDFDLEVQEQVGRIQSEATTRLAIETCRALQFKSINVDLVYGLPKQTMQKFCDTVEKVLPMNPDRVALFNFAFVPWLMAHQRKIDKKTLPSPLQKMEMFCKAIELFQEAGYEFIGLDHFVKKEDELFHAKQNHTMHRNFQGYTTQAGSDLIGMGTTAISHIGNAFAQNEKRLKTYEILACATGLATQRGMILSDDDQIREWVLHELMCYQNIPKQSFKTKFDFNFDNYFAKELEQLRPLQQDGLIEMKKEELAVTPLGRLFLRNIGMTFDAYLKTEQKHFSKTL